MTIVTYGGGEILSHLFNAIAMFFNGGKGDLLRPLIVISASFGALWAIFRALLSNSASALFLNYFLPLLILPGLLMVPSASVHIEDILKNKSYKVDNVPLLLAKFSELTSSIGYSLTKMFERVMHLPGGDEVSYHKTGMLFGSETALDISRYQITNGTFKQNMRQFARQCILYDLALGQYSIEELKKTDDIWKFITAHTSKVRMMPYLTSKSSTSKKGEELASYITCKQAIEKMAPLFEAEKKYYAQHELLKHLPLTFQALTGMQKNKEDLIGQQLMISVLANEYSGENFAKTRALAHQRSTYQTIGSIASGAIVIMRNVIEALAYGIFIFIVPMVFLPGGIKYLGKWATLTIWIQLWPPLYAILNYIMQISAQSHSNTIFQGLSSGQKSLSIFTSIGLQNLNEDLHATAGYLALSIPLISYLVLQGSLHGLHQLSGMMGSSAQAAGANAAAEQTSGNYSLASTNFGQMNFQNSSAFQKNLSPALSSGFMTENRGTLSITHGEKESIVKQASADLRSSVFSDDAIHQNLQKSYQNAQTHVEGAQKSFTDSISNHARSMTDLTEHLASSKSFAHSASDREAYDVQESARYMQNVAENWGQSHGMSMRKSLDTLVDAATGFNLFGFASAHTKGQKGLGVSDDETSNSALNIASSEEFQRNYQKVRDFAESNSFSAMDDEGVRFVEGYTQSLDEVKSFQEQYQSAFNEMNQVSENMSWAQSHAHSIKRSLNQDFINWAGNELKDEGGFSRAVDIISKGPEGEREGLINSFISHLRTDIAAPDNFKEPKTSYQNSALRTMNRQEELSTIQSSSYQEAHEKGLFKGKVDNAANDFRERWAVHQNTTMPRIDKSKFSVAEQHHSVQTSVNNRAENNLTSRLWKESNVGKFVSNLVNGQQSSENFAGKYQMSSKPFWYDED